MDNEPRLITLDEAAEMSGLSIEALRKRITRGRLAAVKGNDGRPRVRLDSLPKRGDRSPDATVRLSGRPDDESGLSKALSMLDVQLERERAVADRERARAVMAEAALTLEQQSRKAAETRADAAEAKVRELEARRARSPWARIQAAIRALGGA